jgi:hypothetical protein
MHVLLSSPTYREEAQKVAQETERYRDSAEELEKLDESFMYRVLRSLCLQYFFPCGTPRKQPRCVPHPGGMCTSS